MIKKITITMTRMILITVFALLISCKKTEEVQSPDTNPIKLENHEQIIANKSKTVLFANLLYLNEEKVIEHGFVVSYNDIGPIKKNYVINKPAEAGIVQLTIDDSNLRKSEVNYSYYYYLKTEKNIYQTQPKTFTPSSVIVDYKNNLQATGAEEIFVSGDFRQLEGDYALYDNKNNRIDYKIIGDTKLSFLMPSTYTHGDQVNFILKSTSNPDEPSIYLAQVKALGILYAPEEYDFKIVDRLKLRGNMVSNSSRDGLKIILGNKEFAYFNDLVLYDLLYMQYGDSFQIGYDNGRDRVIFPKKLRLKKPMVDDIQFLEEYAHPNTKTRIKQTKIYDYLYYPKSTLGGAPCNIYSTWNGVDYITIGDVSDGEYSVEAVSNHLAYASQEKIRIEDLKLTAISNTETYYGEQINLKGNFLPSQEYMVYVGGHNAPVYVTKAGEAYFKNPYPNEGQNALEIAYVTNTSRYDLRIPTNYTVTTKKPTIMDFYPKQATTGTTVVIKGKGLYSASVHIGNMYLNCFWTSEGLTFTIPGNLPKGRYKFNVVHPNNIFITSPDHLEII